MDKQHLLSVIDKYHLNGTVERTKWNVKDNVLNVQFVGILKDITGEVIAQDFNLPDDEIAIFNTSQLYKLISITGQNVTVELFKKHKLATKLLIADNTYNLEYALSDLLLIPKSPQVMEPNYDVEFSIDRELIDKYIKAKRALSDVSTVRIGAEENLSTRTYVATFSIGESSEFTNKINFETPATKSDELSVADVLSFNADYIKDIFDNNKDMDKGMGYLNSEGLLKFEFKNEKITSKYFLPAK
jgi:hypothetical protein